MPGASRALAPGDRVSHPELGRGVVRRLRRGGRALHVSFDAHPELLLEVGRGELTLEQAAAPEARPPAEPGALPGAPRQAPAEPAPCAAASRRPDPTPAPRPPFTRASPTRASSSAAARKAARMIEALRMGVVPRGDLRASSVGRDAELRRVSADLDEAERAGAARVFLGDYGTGKTHLLELIEEQALDRGFLVGRATLDPLYARPSQPMRVYRQVVASLRYPGLLRDGAPRGLKPLLEAAIEQEALLRRLERGEGPLAGHLYLGPALRHFHALRECDDPLPRSLLLDWIGGQRERDNEELQALLERTHRGGLQRPGGRRRVYALKDFQPWAHVYGYLLAGISLLAREVGHAGLVVLLDEAENFDLLGSAATVFAESLFRCLTLNALGEAGVHFAPDSIVRGGFVPQQRLPHLLAWPHHLALFCAMTPSTRGEGLLRSLVGGERVSELTPLALDDYRSLSQRIAALYQQAYPELHLPERLTRPLGDVLWSLLESEQLANPREATKLGVEFLDLLRLLPAELSRFFEDLERVLGS